MREVAEETGLHVVADGAPRVHRRPDARDRAALRHVVRASAGSSAGEARIAEPDKATDLAWLTPAELRARELFAPLRRWLDRTRL